MIRFGRLSGIFFLFLISFCACTKEGTAKFEGYYSYKLSGTLYLQEIIPSGQGEEIVPEELTLHIIPESGQMSLLTEPKDKNSMLIILNTTGGSVATGEVEVSEDQINVNIADKHLYLNINQYNIDDSSNENHIFNIEGTGRKIGETLIINLTTTGVIHLINKDYEIKDSKIECVARINK